MGLLKWMFWTGGALFLGMYLATGDAGGTTRLERLQRAFNNHISPSTLSGLKEDLAGALDEATATKNAPPKERYSAHERDAINKLVAKGKADK